jgi:hypothetical protein
MVVEAGTVQTVNHEDFSGPVCSEEWVRIGRSIYGHFLEVLWVFEVVRRISVLDGGGTGSKMKLNLFSEKPMRAAGCEVPFSQR